MKKQKWIRKGMAFVLSLAMVAGLVPAMSGGANTVKAASGSGTEPSVSAYATKTQLMDDTFAPNANGTAANYGKIVFGKKSDGTTAQEWYILGKDGGVSGDNTIIFAASPIATKQVFENDSTNNKTDSSLWSDCDYSGKSITQVYPCHYGASDLRVALKGMATNTSYFTTAEQDLMNDTTVKTKDAKNSNAIYTTTDKLYALAADGYGTSYKTIKAGSGDSTVLAMSSYWSNGSYFWLRSPKGSGAKNLALSAYPGDYVHKPSVGNEYAVQPASNLNLSSVLFASSATAASSDTVSHTISSDTAMTLRLNGTGKDIGTVTYTTTTGDIRVAKASTSQTVALIVQGNDGKNDWYYSKKIDEEETVNASAIKSALSLSSDIDLSACKIWLEITDTDGMIYAVGATDEEVLSITSVEITGIETPAANTTLDTEAACATTGVSSTTPQITWTPSDFKAGYNTSYTASITLTAGTGYGFINSTTATVSGNNATGVTKNADGTLTVTYAFPATKDKLTSITPPQAITVANGTAYDAINLPATVNIVTEGNTVTSAQVTWDTTTPASGSYDPAVLTQQTVTLNGEVTCPDSVDANGVSLTTTITITISGADTVKAPTANPTAGTYSENQSVTLTSDTEGATIYYTTDGSEPTITGENTKQYTEPILVTGTEGQSITTTIKAIAVKNGMQDSSVETFTYTIHQVPAAKYTYATKTQLMDGTFAPITDGTAVNIGKLVFGKNSSGEAQEWYILGKDERVSGDNTIIFAASPIATGQVFEDDCYNSKTDTSLWSDCDYSGVSITEVSPNHYGASDLRVALQGIAKNTNCFTPAEQGMMNATTVTTKDTNNRVTYTTTDNLYALQGDYQKEKLWAGTSDSTVLASSSYWCNGSQIWLRSPCDFAPQSALFTYPGSYAYNDLTDKARAVRPASNLNLSSVLFASSAKAASSDTVSGMLTDGTAMTLRFDGTGKDIGTVTYNTTTGDIKATKGSTEGDVALVVQGNDGNNDWYYSKKIDAAETVNASDIKSALNLSSDIDLSACKIWLETTDSTENFIYAVGATEVITSVEITGIDTPVLNTALDTKASCATTGVSSTTPQITWTPSDSTAGYNTSYTASITLTAGTGYEFINSTTATVSGNNATSVTKNVDGTLTVTYTFSATAKDKLTSITPPQAIKVANGTAYDAMNLPATVNIVTEGNTVTSAPVTWNTTTPASGSYDPAVLTEQTVTLNGTVDCPDSIDTNGIETNTTITITISAADTVKAPTVNPTAGNYSENQSVTLTSDTEGATIYYTTDGSEPTLTGSTPSGTTKAYTAPILVTGTEGQSITTTIKAIAVKNGMQDSSVETFTYTIRQIPVAKYTYATKTQLMDGTFAPNADGTAVNYGKLVFGKKSDGTTAQEWYILGKDAGVSGDNTIIFAASPIATGQVFSSSDNNKPFNSSFGVYASNPLEVYKNHYGASDLRVALQNMATDTSYFTSAEQGLMNDTTVTTKDMKNSYVTYTTTDKLYALQGDYNNKYLWAGTSDSTVLAMSSYWSSGSGFWLRSPYDYYSAPALLAYPDRYVDWGGVYVGHAVQPASNLNLSSVLFASAATAASSDTVSNTIASETAMTLRFDGTGKNIGTVTYNTTTGDIKVAKGSTSQTVALVVQGNDGTNNWYYSKQITGSETVNASDIKSELSLTSDIDLSACKIWLEITDTDGMIYAIGATEVLSITSVEITGIDTPVSNTALDTEAACATTGVSSTTPQITWTPSDSKAGYNTSYTASITLTAGTGYEFINSTTATVLGNTATSVTKNADGTLTVTYTFSATAKRVIGSVTAPKVPTNNIFTTYYGYEGYDISPVSESNSELGTQATVTFTDSVNPNTEAMDVTWSIANAGGAAYDQTPGAKNTFRWTIPATALTNYSATDCQGYDATTGTITGTVAITNKDYTPVTISGSDVTVTYGGTLNVSQYFTIDENAGTPTYKLSDASTGAGTLEGATLTMTTLGTFVVKVSTSINGVYNKGEHTLTITVNKAASAPGLPNNTMEVDYSKKKVRDITTLPEGWAWQDEDQDKALTVGTAVKATAVYTGADKGNYETESVEISITRLECTHATTEVKNAKDATCTEKGYTGDTCCTVCGKLITAGTDINALGHNFADTFTTDKEATCAEAGSKSKHCSRCDAKSEVTEIPKKEHTWDGGKVTKEPTETAEGVKTYTCSVCGETKTEAIPKKNGGGSAGGGAAEPEEPQKPDTPQQPDTQEPLKKGDVVTDDKASVTVEVTDVAKKEVEYKEPANKKAKTVSIPATVKINGVTYKVTKIADNAFKNNKTITKVTVGSSIKTIGKNAFYKCTKLKTVKIGKNVTEVGANAFKGCSSLTSVTLPSKATKIGANAFSGCKKLKTIKITSTKLTSKTVSKNAFKGLTKATTIKVPKKKLSAYKKLFKQKGLSSKVKVKGY